MTTGKVSFQTFEYMHRLIAELDEANAQLRLEAASVAADERAKIVEWLRYMDDPADYADMIEKGEHLNMPPPTN